MRTIVVSPQGPDRAVLMTAVAVLRAGGVVAYPTDTLYGLAVDPRSERAVTRLFDVKGRDASSAIPLIAASVEQALDAADLGPAARRLAAAFWPGPLSIVAPARPSVSRAILGGGTTVAIRVPSHAVARALAGLHGFAIAATSANLSGAPAASSPDAVREQLDAHVDLLVDGGVTSGGPPSTIVELTDAGPVQRRAGAIAWDRVLESLQ